MILKNPHWNVSRQKNMLIVSAGADELYAIEGKSEKAIAEFLELWKTNFISEVDLDSGVKTIIEELKKSGILYEKIFEDKKFEIEIKWVGEVDENLKQKIENHFPRSDRAAELILLIRTNGEMKDLLNDYPFQIPHLYIDASMHHSTSFGPLVFPEETSCLGCYIGRINTHWGDLQPPAKPKLKDVHGNLLAELIVLELSRIQNDDYSLANRTCAYDFQNRKITEGAVYKLPWCPSCGRSENNKIGKINLPWTNA